ncbi:hypothetical protein EI94DRAFT_938231 [Lactarius quietus]|nr:hypothetical protein EI94DRAFT_938231 [Lactarius quietus]
MNDGKASLDGILRALDMMQQLANDINRFVISRLHTYGPAALTLVTDPSSNYIIVCKIKMELPRGSSREASSQSGTRWVGIRDDPDSFPSVADSGKTILMSAIIAEIDRMGKAGLALMAYFFFRFQGHAEATQTWFRWVYSVTWAPPCCPALI